MDRPALLIDVDGVLNVDTRARRRDPLPEGVVKLRAEDSDRQRWTLYLRPLHGLWLLSLSEQYDLVWCTTWWQNVDRQIAPTLGLPRGLPRVELPPLESTFRRGSVETPFSRKVPHIRAWAACSGYRKLAWIDDEIDARDTAALTTANGGGPLLGDAPPLSAALALRVEPATGLKAEHIDRLRTWASAETEAPG